MLSTEVVSIVMTELYSSATKLSLTDLAMETITEHTERTLTTSTGVRVPARVTGTTKNDILDLCTNPTFSLASTFSPVQHSDNLLHGVPSKGIEGDPINVHSVVRALATIEAAPGVGFALRRVSAKALGRFGVPRTSRHLLKALKKEELEHEGRPGAGMGIQYPVRMDIIHSLGELQSHDAVPALLKLLDARQSSPKGGLHVPAMDALCKILKNDSNTATTKRTTALIEKLAMSDHKASAINAVGVLKGAKINRSLTRLSAEESEAGRLARDLLEDN